MVPGIEGVNAILKFLVGFQNRAEVCDFLKVGKSAVSYSVESQGGLLFTQFEKPIVFL